jgi:DDE family transposase
LSTKPHLVCEQGQKLLSLVLTGGQHGDSPRFIPVLAAIRVPRLNGGRTRTRPDRVLADKACTSKANRDHLRRRGIKAAIPTKT